MSQLTCSRGHSDAFIQRGIGLYECCDCGSTDCKFPEDAKPSPLVIAADQLAQAAQEFENEVFDYESPRRDDLRTALANYKRVREG